MLYYTFKVVCPHCEWKGSGRLIAEAAPPPEARFTVRCAMDGGPLDVNISMCEPCEPFEPTPGTLHYPPPVRTRWWQFWKW